MSAPGEGTPPNIPSASTALSRLNALTVAAESHQSSYDRDLFPHWITITGSRNTRDQDPTTWQPPRSSFRCTYARAWIQVKWYYGLSVDTAEQAAPTNAAAC